MPFTAVQGDVLQTECIYKTTDRKNITYVSMFDRCKTCFYVEPVRIELGEIMLTEEKSITLM